MKETTFEYAEDIISKAMMFAISAHSGQFRKDKRTPAIIHAMEAAVIVASMTGDMELMAAALLHDTIEDTDVEPEQVRTMFGERVAALVCSETEDKHREMSAEDSWMLRKQESIDELKAETDIAVKMLWLGDKLSNMRSFHRMYMDVGDEMWNRFHMKDKSKHEWYYRTVCDAISELKDTQAYQEYTRLINIIFGGD